MRRYEGSVVQVLGDGIMALFGAPIAQEDHAIRACYAALRMQQRITEYGDDVQRTHGIPVLIRVGVNSGEVVLRSLGPDPAAISAVGQTVHVASRLEQLAKPGTILASADTAALGAARIRTRELGPVNVKGLAEPIEVFEVVGRRELGDARRLDLAHHLSPGRSPERARPARRAARRRLTRAPGSSSP